MDKIKIERTWLQGSPVQVDNLMGNAFVGEAGAHEFLISGKDNAGNVVPITGTITGKFLSSTMTTFALSGYVAEGVASVTLPSECYGAPGQFVVSIFATNGSTTTCIYCGVGSIFRTSTAAIAYPTTTLPDLTLLINQLDDVIASFPADLTHLLGAIAPTFVDNQPFTAGQYVWYNQVLYRFTADHPAGSWAGSADTVVAVIGTELNSTVRYTQQVLTDAQKTVARTNIDAADADDVTDLELTTVQVTPQTFDDNSKSQARSNIGAASSGDLNALSTLVNNQGGYISDLNAVIGTVPTGETVEGQITELKSALNVVEEQFPGISGEILPPSFEIGQRYINGSNSEVWAENSKRLTFTRGSYLNLKQGDTVECDTSVIASYFGGYTTNGGTSFNAISTQTGKYTIPVNGVYFFTLNKVGGGDFTSDDVINGWKYITFTRSGSIKEDVDDLSDRVDSFEQIYIQIENGHTALTLEWTQSEYIKPSTGKITASGNSFYSTEQFYSIDRNAFKIEVNNIHAYSGTSCSVAFYTSDSEDAFISCIETDNPVLTSANIPPMAKYMRFCHQTANNPVTDVSCVAYYFERLDEIEETAQAAKESADAVAENYIIPIIKDVLIDKTTIPGKQPQQVAGKTMYDYIDTATVNSSKPFSVLPQTKYTFAVKSSAYEAVSSVPVMVCAYDSDGVYIDRYNNFTNPFTTPANCHYLIIIIRSTEFVSDIYVENTDELHLPFGDRVFNDYAKTSLLGAKWLVFGDSITDNNARAAGNYHDFIRAETGCVVINEGISGSGYYQTGGVKSIPTAIADYDGETPDIITIMAGINDIMFAVDVTPQILPIGDYTDTGDTSLIGYVYTTYQALLTKFPLTTFAIMSPIPEVSYPQTNPNNSLKKFVDELHKFCDYYGIPFLDQYTQSPLRPWVSAFNQKYFSSVSAPSGDGLHPNYYGHKLLYPRIREFVKTLI